MKLFNRPLTLRGDGQGNLGLTHYRYRSALDSLQAHFSGQTPTMKRNDNLSSGGGGMSAGRGRPYDTRGPPVAAHRRPQTSATDQYRYRPASDRPRRRDRSRSRSPDEEDENEGDSRHVAATQRWQQPPATASVGAATGDPLEQERRARMARLRAENEDEERRLAALDNKTNSSDSYHHHDPKSEIIQVDASELEGLSEEEQMQRLLGFGDFTSTKGQAVEDNQTSAARGAATKNKARKYRQYMNRKGGFNRPLEKMD